MAFGDKLKKAFGKKNNEKSKSPKNLVYNEEEIKMDKFKHEEDNKNSNSLSENKLDIFVSYAKEDKRDVIPKINSISQMGTNVKYHEEIPQGNKLDEIYEFIENCDILVVFVTDNSTKSQIVEDEFRYAIDKQKEILAIFDDDFDKIKMSNIWKFELLNVEHIYQKLSDEEKFISEFESFIQNFEDKKLKSNDESNIMHHEGENPYIYVIYDDNDYKLAFREVRTLQAMDCNVFFVENDEYLDSNLPYIENSKLVMFLISNNSISSKKVLNEVKYIKDNEKSLLPIYLENVDETDIGIQLEEGLSIHDDDYISRLARRLEDYGVKKIDPTSSKLVPGKGREPIPAYDGENPFIFISYAHKDGYKVFPEIKLFQDMGYNVWYDEGISPGNEWLADILKYLDGSSYFVVFVTNNSVASVNVKKEIKYAINENKPILPIFLEDFDEIKMSGELDGILKKIQGIQKTTMENDEYVFKFEKAFGKESIKSLINFEYDEKSRKFIKKYTFTHINYLIHSGAKSISLNSDIVFDEEDGEFLNGINLDVDGIHIDGCGNSIDAKGKAHIFNISARNIVFENVQFKNAYNKSDGGAITIDSSSCSFDNCIFSNNSSDQNGGVFDIRMAYDLKFEKCVFKNNSAKWGSVIYNADNDLEFSMCRFSSNESENGEVIVSDERADVNIQNCMPRDLKIKEYPHDSIEIIGDDPDWDLEHEHDWNCSFEYDSASEMKLLPIYISGTFIDMHAERDYLVKEVFPELQEWCKKYNIEITPIDQRWGITEEDTINNNGFAKMLSNIDKCRPFFLCFLGQHRGWVPDFDYDISEETKSKYFMDLFSAMSATEMEIEHAFYPSNRLFEECPPMRHSLFFFRDDSYLDDITDYQKLIYTNESEGSEERIRLADEKLAETKEYIRRKKADEDYKSEDDETKINILINDYKGHWDKNLVIPELSSFRFQHGENQGGLTDFECNERSLGEVIIEQLKNEIMVEFGIEENFEPVLRENGLDEFLSMQNHYCTSMDFESRFFISDESTAFLSDYLQNHYDNKICLVIAPASYDNTLLMARFATESSSLSNITVYKRFCGLNIDSLLFLWQSICDESGIPKDSYLYPYSIKDLKRKIQDILDSISQNGKTILIIDGINLLDDGLEMFEWIGKLPGNLKLIISVVMEPEISHITEYPYILYKGFKLDALEDKDDKIQVIDMFSSYTLKEFDNKHIDEICSLPGSANPLYLRILLGELRLFASFDELDEEIKCFGDSPLTAFDHVLERLENDEKFMGGIEVVKALFSLLACSQSGLSENEIVDIIENMYDLDDDTIRMSVAINLRQVKPFMIKNGEYYSFFYEKFREAAEIRYVDFLDDSRYLLADYFMSKADLNGDFSFVSRREERSLNELTHYLNEAKKYDDLSNVLSSFAFIKNKLELSTINDLIADYQFGRNHVFMESYAHPIVLIGKALELSTQILLEDKTQLPAQLWGRLCNIDEDLIQKLLDEIAYSTSDMWLKSQSSSLYSPLDVITQRFDVNLGGVKSPIAMTPNNEFIYQKDGALLAFDFIKQVHRILDEDDSNLIKIILVDNFRIFAAYGSGSIKELDIVVYDTINIFKIPGELTDIFYSEDENKIYASSKKGVFSIDLLNNNVRKEVVYGDDEYSKILLSESGDIVVCSADEVNLFSDSFKQIPLDLYDDEYSGLIVNKDIRFIGFVDRFLVTISDRQMDVADTENLENKQSNAITSPQDKFAQAIILENNRIAIISDMGILRVWSISDEDDGVRAYNDYDNQTGIRPIDMGLFTKDGEMLYVAGFNSIYIVDLNKKVEANDEIKHSESVLSVETDENHVITASENGEIYIWDSDYGNCINRFTVDLRYNCISYNGQDSRLILAGVKRETDGRVTNKISVCEIGEDMWEFMEHDCYFADLDAEDYRITDKEVIGIAQNISGIVFIEEDKLTIDDNEIPLDKVATTLTAEFNSDNVLVGFEDGSIVEYPGKNTFVCDVESPVTKIKVLGNKLIAGYGDGSVVIFDGNQSDILKEHEKAITDLYADDSKIISLSEDSTVKFWDIENNDLLLTQYFDVYPTSIGVKDDKIMLGFSLGEVIFFSIENCM
ncbi:TIR domain-containing protein [Methanobrevibacter sp.]|uniref:TIR domain-containing protein n=1 Tax=Methanobrevibacter sp. TaxID=66852 RepID=UPI00386A8F9E